MLYRPAFWIFSIPFDWTLIPMVLSPAVFQPPLTVTAVFVDGIVCLRVTRRRYVGDTAEIRPVRTQVRSTWREYSSRPICAWRPGQFLYPSRPSGSRSWTRELRPNPRRSITDTGVDRPAWRCTR